MVESTANNMQTNDGNSLRIVDDTTNNNNLGTSASNKSEDRQHEPNNNNADAPSKEDDNGDSNDGIYFSGNEEQSNKDDGRGGSSEGNDANNAISVGTSTYSSSSMKQPEKDMSNNSGASDNMTDRKDNNAPMEVEEEGASDNSGNKMVMEDEGTAADAAANTKVQRRSSKRQRSSSTSSNNVDVGLTKKSKQDGGDNKKKEDDSCQQWATTTPTYRWIDDPDTKGDHQGLEIDFGGRGASDDPSSNNNNKGTNNFTVRPGDIILISSGDVPWDNNKDSTDTAQSLPPQQKDGEAEVAIYIDPASREPGIGALDPFIGYVERLYEGEDSTATTVSKNNKDATKSCLQKMKVRTRWFFKKEEIKGLSGRFVLQGYQHGDAKDEIYGAMSSNDLILTDQSDDNIVTSILRKVTVVKRKPLDGSNNDEDMQMTTPEGAFVCRYELKLFPGSSSSTSGGKGRVELYPFEDVSDNFVIPTDGGDENNNVGSTDEELSSSGKEERGDDASNTDYAQVPYPMSPRRVISEGPTVGKIHVGPNHQAVIPEQIDLERKASRRGMANPPLARMPTLVWDPKSNEDSVVNSFLDEACSMLIQKRITTAGMKPFHEVNCVESPDPHAETKRPRECRIDCLLTELHQCKYDVKKALKRVSENPDKFMTIWTSNEKEQFDASYRAYRESLRAISQSMGEERSTNDVIDYLYRFKLVENFRRFTAKKREKAREMMESVENRMLNEKAKEDAKNEYVEESDDSSSEDDKGKRTGVLSSVSTAGPVNNRIRTWFRTGGGDEDAVGATQLRRNEAANLLSKIKETVGEEAYLVLAKSLKTYYAHSDSSLTEVKNTAADIMKAHPDLLKTFEHFLPREIRS